VLFALAPRPAVACTDFCDYPPAARAKPRWVAWSPQLEAIVSLRPDVVIATTEGNREETSPSSRARYPDYLVAAHHVRDVTDLIARLGALTDANRRRARCCSARARVAAVTDRLRGPACLYVLWPSAHVPGREALGPS